MGRLGLGPPLAGLSGLVPWGRVALLLVVVAALGWLSVAETAQAQAPVRWTLAKKDRVVHLLSFGSIVSEHFDERGGSVDMAVDGKALDLCSGGRETMHFDWQFPQDISHITSGESRAVVVVAQPLHADEPCVGYIAAASSISAASSGSWPYDTERNQIDVDRVGISGPYKATATQQGERASPGINFGLYPLKTDAPFTYFHLVIDLRGAGSVDYVYMYRAETGDDTGAGSGDVSMEPGVNRPGGDYAHSDADQPAQCQSACASDATCKAFTFVNPGIQGPRGVCWLKSSVPAAQSDSCCTSGIRAQKPPPTGSFSFEPGVDRGGSDYSHFVLSNDDPHACEASCAEDGQCLAYTFVRAGVHGPGAECWLKNAVPSSRADQCCTSGVRQ